jgi:hypothetical protein
MHHVDSFDRFAAECGLTVTAEALYAAPRDVLHPPADSDRHYLVTIRRDAVPRALCLVYLTPLTDVAPPSVRDVLWWLAGDAWAVERAGRRLDAWAADHGYARDDATDRLFECHCRQATALRDLVGEAGYRRLLDLYHAEVAPRGPRLA